MDENQNSQPDGVSPSELEEHFSETSSEARKNSLSDIVNESLHREEAEAKREEVEFQETKKRLEEERKREKIQRHPIDLISRISHIVGYTVISLLFLAFTFFIGGSALDKNSESSSMENVFFLHGKASIVLPTGESFFAKQENNILFGGEEITFLNGDAEVRFWDGTRIRFEKDADVKILQVFPNPIIQHISGKIWVFGQENPEIRYENATFFARGTSAFFEKTDTLLIAATLRHPLLAEVWAPESSEHVSFIIPTNNKISFIPNRIPQSIASIHYSKLKKELHISSIEPDNWALQNVLEDRRSAEDILAEFLQNRRTLFLSGFIDDIRKKLIVFESKKEKNEKDKQTSRTQFLIEEYILGVGAYDVQLSDMTTDDLNMALYAATLVDRPDSRLLNKVMDIVQEFRKRENAPHKERIIAHTILSLFEEALLQNDEQMVQKILQEQVNYWQKENVKDDQNKRFLEMYREILAGLFQSKVQMVTPELFDLAAKLDTVAISSEEKGGENAFVTALEIIQRNFGTADTFLEKGDLSTAGNILRENRALLKAQNPPQKLILTYRDYVKRQDELEEKYDVFQEFGVMTEENVAMILEERKSAEEAIETIRNSEGFAIALAPSQEQESDILLDIQSVSEITEEDRIREDFSEIGCVVISAVTETRSDDGAILISEAVLPNGDSFSAEYFPDTKVVRNVEVPAEEIFIETQIKLMELPLALDASRNTAQDPSSIRLARENLTTSFPSQKEEDPLAKVDPVVMDVTRRQAQKELQKYGYEVGILNIAMTSETSISVKEIHMPFLGSNTVSLVIEKAPQQKAVLKDIFIEPYHVAVKETDIEHLSEETENAFNEFLALEELRGQTEWVLLDAGITIASQNVRIDGDRIVFSSGKYYSWTLSGTADPEQQIFPLISRDNREFLRDIHFDDLRETLRLELMKINPDIFSEEEAS